MIEECVKIKGYYRKGVENKKVTSFTVYFQTVLEYKRHDLTLFSDGF